jgi:hypothetical protein
LVTILQEFAIMIVIKLMLSFYFLPFPSST